MHVPVSRGLRAGGGPGAGRRRVRPVGGGSAIGLGKAFARDTGLPLVAVPTTYAGSEMTPVWGLTEDGREHRSRRAGAARRRGVRPGPVDEAARRAVGDQRGHALAHAVEALWAPDATPVTRLRPRSRPARSRALPRVVANRTLPAGADLLYGAWLAGSALAPTTMGLHHRSGHRPRRRPEPAPRRDPHRGAAPRRGVDAAGGAGGRGGARAGPRRRAGRGPAAAVRRPRRADDARPARGGRLAVRRCSRSAPPRPRRPTRGSRRPRTSARCSTRPWVPMSGWLHPDVRCQRRTVADAGSTSVR